MNAYVVVHNQVAKPPLSGGNSHPPLPRYQVLSMVLISSGVS